MEVEFKVKCIVDLEDEIFYKLIDELTERIKKEEKLKERAVETYDWVDKESAKKLLGIKSQGKLRSLVKGKYIVAAKHGRTLMYSKKSIGIFLDKSKL